MSREVIQYLPIERLVERSNVRERFDEESIDETASTIKEVGILQPLRAQLEDNQAVVVVGARRLRAAKKAGLKTVPVILEERQLNAAEIIQRQVIEDKHQDLRPLETARGVADYMTETGYSATEAAQKLGLSDVKISRLLSLLSLPDDIQNQIESGAVPASFGYELAKIGDPVKQSELARNVAAGRLTRDAVSGEVKRQKKGSKSSDKSAPSRAVAKLSGGRSIALSGPGLTSVESLIQWLEELLSAARRIRSKNWSLSTFLNGLRDETQTEAPT